MKRPRIPHTDSIQELAQFWDAHDLTDFGDQLEEVTEQVFERDTILQIRLPTQEASAVKEIAKAKGVAYTDLLREWVLEKLHRS